VPHGETPAIAVTGPSAFAIALTVPDRAILADKVSSHVLAATFPTAFVAEIFLHPLDRIHPPSQPVEVLADDRRDAFNNGVDEVSSGAELFSCALNAVRHAVAPLPQSTPSTTAIALRNFFITLKRENEENDLSLID
jgi:hypothetical protein